MRSNTMERLSFTEGSPTSVIFCDDQHYVKYEGCYINRPKGTLLFLIYLLSVVLVGCLVYHYTGCKSVEIVGEDSMFNASVQWEDMRLSSDVTPIFYHLEMKPDLNNYTYEGTVWITFSSSKQTSEIELNAKRLNISKEIILTTAAEPKFFEIGSQHVYVIPKRVQDTENKEVHSTEVTEITETTESLETTFGPSTTVTDQENSAEKNMDEDNLKNGEELPKEYDIIKIEPLAENNTPATVLETIKVLKYKANNTLEKMTVYIENPIQPNKTYTMIISFNGRLNNGTTGFFWRKYSDFGETKFLASAQLQPALARSLFPCFDEPRFKAPFEITIARNSSMQVVSNTELRQSVTKDDNLIWDHFKITPPIYPSSIFFVISDLSVQELQLNDNKALCIWSRKELKERAMSASIYIKNLLEAYSVFLKMDFDEFVSWSPKLNLIATPKKYYDNTDSFGIIDVREQDLYIEPDSSSMKNRLNSIKITSLQIGHALFNGLLTFENWSDLWLSAAVTKYISMFVLNQTEQELNSDNYHFTETTDMMRTDSFLSASSLREVYVNPNRNRNEEKSSAAVKGAAILKMSETFLGGDTLEAVLRTYLLNAYNSPKSLDICDFFENMTQNSSLNINTTMKDFLSTWTEQKGYPVINVSIDYSDGIVTLTQGHFSKKPQEEYLWHVPISFTTSESVEKWTESLKAWMKKDKEIKLSIPALKNNLMGWIIINDNRKGFYRVNYDINTWTRILNTYSENREIFPEKTKAQLIDDAFNLAFEGYISFDIPLSFCKALKSETSYLVWHAALTNLKIVEDFLANAPSYGLYKKFILSILIPIYKEVNKNPDTISEILISYINKWSCHFGESACLSWAQDLFHDFLDPSLSNPIPLSQRENIYCTAVETSDSVIWDTVYEAALNETEISERNTLLRSLSCTEESWILNRLFQRILDNSELSAGDAVTILNSFQSVLSSKNMLRILRDYWEPIYEKFHEFPIVLSSFITTLDKLNHRDDLEQFVDLIRLHEKSFESIPLTINIVQEKIINNIDYRRQYLNNIASWLLQNTQTSEEEL